MPSAGAGGAHGLLLHLQCSVWTKVPPAQPEYIPLYLLGDGTLVPVYYLGTFFALLPPGMRSEAPSMTLTCSNPALRLQVTCKPDHKDPSAINLKGFWF